jgi:DNA-binding SARP family transcriptional activator
MVHVFLELLGRPVVRRLGSTPTPIPTGLQTFLAFMCFERDNGCTRERVIDALWPDLSAETGRRRLNTAVWRSRNLLGADAAGVVLASRSGRIALDRSAVSVDVAPMITALSDNGRAAAADGDAQAIAALRRAVVVDAEQFLTGNYDEWAVQTRRGLELSIVNGVATLLQAASEPREAIDWAELLVRLDPLREDAHRHLIRLYADAGRRADALRQYDTCVRHLRDDLGVDPLIETSLVAAAVRSGVPPMPNSVADPRRALQALRDALEASQTVIEMIESAIAALPPD